jgi:ubiquinone/menaquinone biosynthesis C-methylase UbiE
MTDMKFWDNIAPKYAKSKISDMEGYNETLERIRFYLKPEHNVLEIGCGTGSTGLQIADGVASYLGTDIAPAMIKLANSKLGGSAANMAFTAAPAGEMPDGDYDVVLGLNLLHVIPDLSEVLNATYDALPSGGLFIAKTALLRDGNWLIPKIMPLMQFLGKAPSALILSDAQLKAALADAGFELIETLTQTGIVPRIFTVARKP